MANAERFRSKEELKFLFRNIAKKGITGDMVSILVDVLWRDKTVARTNGFFFCGGTDCIISFDKTTRKFSIKPLDPLVTGFKPRFRIFSNVNQPILHRRFEEETITIPNEEGLYAIYYTAVENTQAQSLEILKNPTVKQRQELYEKHILISFIYWDATNQQALCFGDDRHGSQINPQQHWINQQTLHGLRQPGGLSVNGMLINEDGSANSHAQFALTAGSFWHGDFIIDVPNPAGGTTALPVLYFLGENKTPRFALQTGFQVINAGRLAYNQNSQSIAQATNNYHVAYHVFATNDQLANQQIVSVMGQNQYEKLAECYAQLKNEVNTLYALAPQQGMCYLGSVILQTSNDYTNTVKARVVGFSGDNIHAPVSIAPGSEDYLGINEDQELVFKEENLPEVYSFNLSAGTETAFLPSPSNVQVEINGGSGSLLVSFPEGAFVVSAINANGETLATNCPAGDVYDDTTSCVFSWDAVSGATGYRLYPVGDDIYIETTETSVDMFLFVPDQEGTPPTENTAAIENEHIQAIENGDTVKVVGEGIGVEMEVDETVKTITLTKQQSDWDETDEENPNFIANKPVYTETIKTFLSDYKEAYLIEETSAVSLTQESSWGVTQFNEQIGTFEAKVVVTNKDLETIVELKNSMGFDNSGGIEIADDNTIVTGTTLTLALAIDATSKKLKATVANMPTDNKRVFFCFERCILSARSLSLVAEMEIPIGMEASLSNVLSIQAGMSIPVEMAAEVMDGNASAVENVKCGYLYNWYVASDEREVANEGWKVPLPSDFAVLSTHAGGNTVAGGKLKEIGIENWATPNTGATNEYGFNGVPSGIRYFDDGHFGSIAYVCWFWTQTENKNYGLTSSSEVFHEGHDSAPKWGMSIRLVKESTSLSDGETSTYVGNDGKIYRTICIGTQEWLADNLKETKYRNGDTITEVTDNTTWAALTTGARCSYNNDENNA